MAVLNIWLIFLSVGPLSTLLLYLRVLVRASSAGGNDLQPEPTFSSYIADRNLVDGDNRRSVLVFITASLMGLVSSSNMLYTDAIYIGEQDDYCGYNSLY